MLEQIICGLAVGGVMALAICLLIRRGNPHSALASAPLMLMFGMAAGSMAAVVLPMTDIAPWLFVKHPGPSSVRDDPLATGEVVEITDASHFDGLIRRSRAPVLVDFGADWCPPCRRMRPILEQFARERAGRTVVLSVNVDGNRPLASRHGIRSIPALFVYMDGRIVARATGFHNIEGLAALVDGLQGRNASRAFAQAGQGQARARREASR